MKRFGSRRAVINGVVVTTATLRERSGAIRQGEERREAQWRAARAAMLEAVPEAARWHVAQTGMLQERAAERALSEAGFIAYCPLERVTHKVAGQRRDIERALFPRYVFFARGALPASLAGVVEVKGVLAGSAGVWSVVPSAMITALMQAEGVGRFDRSDKAREAARRERFRARKVGDLVRIATGALAGWPAKIAAVRPDDRVECLISLLGGETRAVIGLDDVDDVA